MSERLGIGVDVGGTSIKLGVVDGSGAIVQRSALATEAEQGPDHVIDRIALGIDSLLRECGRPVAGIGLGVPGVVDADGNVSYPPNFPGWEIVPVAERLRLHLDTDLPIVVENDANVAALAEARVGIGGGARSFLFVTLGTGVGGCIVHEGTIWRGTGEFGHTTVDLHGRRCNCGSRGCIEAYIGQRYMTAIAGERLPDHSDSLLHRLLADGGELDPKLINDTAEAGDPFARNFLAEMGEYLGAALASAMNFCDLHLAIVGGGMSRAERYLIEPARRSLRERVLKSIAGDVELRIATLSNDAGIVGAALLGREAEQTV